MNKSRITKTVGIISNDVVDKYKLYDYKDKKIVQSLDLYIHIAKHVREFSSIDSYNHAISSIPDIISNPYFVYYNPTKKSLLYFKEIDEDVCVVVKLKLEENKDCYIATLYPTSKEKIQKYIELSYILNRE